MLGWHSRGSSCPFCLCLPLPPGYHAQHHSVPWGHREEAQDSASILNALKGSWNAHTLVLSGQWHSPFDMRGNQGQSANFVTLKLLWQDWPRKTLNKFLLYKVPRVRWFGPTGDYFGYGRQFGVEILDRDAEKLVCPQKIVEYITHKERIYKSIYE